MSLNNLLIISKEFVIQGSLVFPLRNPNYNPNDLADRLSYFADATVFSKVLSLMQLWRSLGAVVASFSMIINVNKQCVIKLTQAYGWIKCKEERNK